MDNTIKPKWHTVDAAAVAQLTMATNSPGVVYPVASTALPQQIQKMEGISSYYISGYLSPVVWTNGLTIGGEMVVARSGASLTKNYNFVFATSSNGNVMFNGPYTGFGHHISSGQSVAVNSLFGQTPFTNK
ncbi:MAG: hypothetical protein HYR49_03170 [Gammaproteobacteria bacterium]|nr:hypothetical protein [Gammaproteobacteria bacterium]